MDALDPVPSRMYPARPARRIQRQWTWDTLWRLMATALLPGGWVLPAARVAPVRTAACRRPGLRLR